MRRRMQSYSQAVSGTFPLAPPILPARPERTFLFLSTVLLIGVPRYRLGRSRNDGISFPIDTTASVHKLCKEDFGGILGLPLWNDSGGSMRVALVEEWEVPTGGCECGEEDLSVKDYRTQRVTLAGASVPVKFAIGNYNRVTLIASGSAVGVTFLCTQESDPANHTFARIPVNQTLIMKVADFGPLIQGDIWVYNSIGTTTADCAEVFDIARKR
jgi:hypothetical protein